MEPEVFYDEEDRIESIQERAARERADSGVVANDETIPLLPHAKKDKRHTVVSIHVYKMDEPNRGFKGEVAPTTDFPDIARMFGNGTYDFEGVTDSGKRLQRSRSVKLQMPEVERVQQAKAPAPVYTTPDMTVLNWQREQHAKDQQYVQDLATNNVSTLAKILSDAAERERRSADAAAQRERDYMNGMLQQQQQFFASMQTLQHQQFTQSMERQRVDFQQSVALTETRATQQDPMMLLNIFKEALSLNAPAEESDESEEPAQVPWLQAIDSGTKMISEIANAAKIKTLADVKTKQIESGAQKPQNTSLRPVARGSAPRPANKPAPANPPARARTPSPFSTEQLRTMVMAKKFCEQKGIDFDTAVRNAMHFIATQGSNESGAISAEVESGEQNAASDVA